MRLSDHDRVLIKEAVSRHIPDGKVYLFGSRTDEARRGGDIDLLIIGRRSVHRRDLVALRLELLERLGDQKIDVLYQVEGSMTPFAKLALIDGRAL
jgi:predicted nucleotidyltransferase